MVPDARSLTHSLLLRLRPRLRSASLVAPFSRSTSMQNASMFLTKEGKQQKLASKKSTVIESTDEAKLAEVTETGGLVVILCTVTRCSGGGGGGAVLLYGDLRNGEGGQCVGLHAQHPPLNVLAPTFTHRLDRAHSHTCSQPASPASPTCTRTTLHAFL